MIENLSFKVQVIPQMNELRIPATKSSPEILLNPEGMIRIRGRSINENMFDFFKPVEIG